MPNLALCTYALPGGRTCRQPRLRDQAYCRFHIRNYEVVEREASLDRFFDELQEMDMPQLLETLRDKLENIRCALRCYPEAKLALFAVIDRIARPNPLESMIEAQPAQIQ